MQWTRQFNTPWCSYSMADNIDKQIKCISVTDVGAFGCWFISLALRFSLVIIARFIFSTLWASGHINEWGANSLSSSNYTSNTIKCRTSETAKHMKYPRVGDVILLDSCATTYPYVTTLTQLWAHRSEHTRTVSTSVQSFETHIVQFCLLLDRCYVVITTAHSIPTNPRSRWTRTPPTSSLKSCSKCSFIINLSSAW